MPTNFDTIGTIGEAVRIAKFPPIITGLLGYGEMVSATAAVALRNLGVIYGSPGVPVGTAPTYSAAGASVPSTGRIDLFDDSAAYTRFFMGRGVGVVNGTSATYSRFMGNRVAGSGGGGFQIQQSAGALYLGGLALNTNTTIADARISLTDTQLNQYRLYAMRMTSAGAITIWEYVSGLTATNGGSTAYVPISGRPVRISDVTGTTQAVAWGAHNVALSDADVATQLAWFAAQATLLGITLGS